MFLFDFGGEGSKNKEQSKFMTVVEVSEWEDEGFAFD